MCELVPFTEDLLPAVKAFNQRLLAGGLDKALLYPENHVPRFPPREGARVHQLYFLLADTDRQVRGGFILTQEHWSFYGENAWVAHLRLPISEGVVDRRFKAVGPQVFQSALQTQPNLYMLGMGGFQTAVSRRLASLGWSMRAVPFYFKFRRAGLFFRTSPYLRRKAALRMAANLAAFSGLGPLAVRGCQFLRGLHVPRRSKVLVQETPVFGAWAGDIWERVHRAYGLIAPRDAETLHARYPAEEPRFRKLQFVREDQAFGWAVVLDTQMHANKYFGDARVGAIVDCLASPRDAGAVIHGATQYLCGHGVDVLVCNHSHSDWCRALRHAGYLRGPSNYVLALSPQLAGRVQPFHTKFSGFFVTRGDGAGPERLME